MAKQPYEIAFDTHGNRPAFAGQTVSLEPAEADRINAKLPEPLYVLPGTLQAKEKAAAALAAAEAGEVPKPRRRKKASASPVSPAGEKAAN